MEVIYPLIVGFIFLGVVIIGYGVWNVLTWTSNPFQIWANSKIEDCESRWENEDEE